MASPEESELARSLGEDPAVPLPRAHCARQAGDFASPPFGGFAFVDLLLVMLNRAVGVMSSACRQEVHRIHDRYRWDVLCAEVEALDARNDVGDQARRIHLR